METTHESGVIAVKQAICVNFADLNATARKVNFGTQISPRLALFSQHRILPIRHKIQFPGEQNLNEKRIADTSHTRSDIPVLCQTSVLG